LTPRQNPIVAELLPAERALAPSAVVRLWDAIIGGVARYGFSIAIRALEPPKTETFDGLEIVLSPANPLELQCFLLLHLFGHSVQWVAPSLRAALEPLESSPDLESFLVALRHYESEAAQFGLKLMHECGITDCDQWLADCAASDWRYVERFYREGVIPPLSECHVVSAPAVVPLAIPPLEQRVVQVRFAF